MLLFAVTLPAIVATPAPSLDGRSIFLRARAAVDAAPVPPYIVFTFQNYTSEANLGGFQHKDRLRVAVRTSDGHAFVQTLRLSEGMFVNSEPAVVGDNGIAPNTGFYRLGDFPAADFGMRRSQMRPGVFESQSAPEPTPAPDAPRLLATVSAQSIPYDIERLGDDKIDDRAMYHLRLSPVRDPNHNILRELWIDTDTFLPRRYLVDRYVGHPMEFHYRVTVDAARLSQYLLNYGGHGQLQSGKRVADAEWEISDVSFPAALPDWIFDPATFRLHRTDPWPAALATHPVSVPVLQPLPVFRHLAFDFESAAGHADGLSSPNTTGRIVVDILKATADHGLIVDVTENSTATSIPTIRVGITAEGTLISDAAASLTREEDTLLHLLGRDVVGPAARQDGDAWDVTENGANPKVKISFRVISATTPDGELLDFTERIEPAGRSLEDLIVGTLTYDSARSVPVRASLRTESHRNTGDLAETKTATSFALVEDSFASH